MKRLFHRTLRLAVRRALLRISLLLLALHFPLAATGPAPARTFHSECGAEGTRCGPAVIEEFYSEYASKVMSQPGDGQAGLERLAGEAQATGALLKAFLDAGHQVRSQDLGDYAARISHPNAVWLFTQPHFAGMLRQFRTDAASLPQGASYRSLRLGGKVYVELFSEPQYAGARRAAYANIADFSAWGGPAPPQSLRLRQKAEITVQPIYSPEVRRDMPSPEVGMSARVSLRGLHLDIAIEHQPCHTPCYDDACPSDTGFFYDPVRPVYDDKAPEKSWYGKYPMQLMINTSYFKVCAKRDYSKAKCANGSGLLVQGGAKLLGESVRDDSGNLLDAIVFWKDSRAELFYNRDIPKDLSRAEVALGGNWFFTDDEYHCDGCHDPDNRHPRTALGLDEDGRMLFIVVVQPGQKDRKNGYTAGELHALMRQLGASRGLMLDGGGSSQFVYIREGGEPAWTVPAGDREGYRPVPSALGIVGLKDAN